MERIRFLSIPKNIVNRVVSEADRLKNVTSTKKGAKSVEFIHKPARLGIGLL